MTRERVKVRIGDVAEVYDGPHYPEKPSWYTDERDAH